MNFVVGSNLFLSARGVALPERASGSTRRAAWTKTSRLDDSGVWHGSSWNYLSDRPQQTIMAEGSYFRGSTN